MISKVSPEEDAKVVVDTKHTEFISENPTVEFNEKPVVDQPVECLDLPTELQKEASGDSEDRLGEACQEGGVEGKVSDIEEKIEQTVKEANEG